MPYPNVPLSTVPLNEDLDNCAKNNPSAEFIEISSCRNPVAPDIHGKLYYFNFNPQNIEAATVNTGIPSNPQETFLVCVASNALGKFNELRTGCSSQ